MKPDNPFLISGYESPEYFCDREQETKRMLEAIRNKRNLTLMSARRMGKTGLIRHAFHHLQKESAIKCFYVDILPTASLADFVRLLSKAILNNLDTTPEKIIKKIFGFFSSLRPVVSYDPMTGEPSVTLDMKASESEKTLEQLFAYLAEKEKKVVIAIDEFQQITQYAEKKTEALLRAHMQQNPAVRFIFSGSNQHLLSAMFAGHSRPFYQSTEMMTLEPIDRKQYAAFIIKKFRQGKREIDKEEVEAILDWTRGYTWYVQFVCNRLFAMSAKKYNKAILINLLLNILKENEPVYTNYRNLLTEYQWKLLIATAKEEAVAMPTSGEFISKYKLGSPSSVKTALEALLYKQLMYQSENGYRVYDVFLSRWLERW